MTAIYIQNAIKSKNESLRLDDFKITPGEGYYTVTNKCNEYDVDTLKPKGRTSIENGATKRTVESLRIAKERKRIGTWNVRTLNNGNLELVKREMEKTDVDLLGISEMNVTEMGHFTSDEHYIYYCGQETLKRI